MPSQCRAISAYSLIALSVAAFMEGCGESVQPPTTEQEAVKLSPEQEFAALTKKAEAGDADAQARLGDMYFYGEGIDKDAVKAVQWYQKAAAQGYSAAQFLLGARYQRGEGIAKDAAKAVEWYQKAAAQGVAEAQYHLGEMYAKGEGVAKDEAKAVKWYQKSAAQGDVLAQSALGWMFAHGEGVTKDATKAVEWFREAAEQGFADAQFQLGQCYHHGDGVPKDASKSFEWHSKAAEQGFAKAQEQLGVRYALGIGAPKDSVLAYVWFNLAAAQGQEDSAKSRNLLDSHLTMVELQEAQRLSSSWKLGTALVRGGAVGVVAEPKPSSGALGKQGTGTVFVVGKNGHAITNHHVVQGCIELRIEGREGVAKVVTDDKINDLALLQISGDIKVTAPISDVPTKLRQGEDIVVFGFPLNAFLSSGGNLTPGVVSALTGIGNNTNQIQITAPIQPGSSGSPVLNKKGEVVGVISMKLDDTKMAKATGQVGQNVNFAVSGQTLKTFLDTHKVSYTSGSGFFSRDKSTADLADEARKWTLVVECWK